jgi:stalled ribosome alternative rescue factor ArfA
MPSRMGKGAFTRIQKRQRMGSFEKHENFMGFDRNGRSANNQLFFMWEVM